MDIVFQVTVNDVLATQQPASIAQVDRVRNVNFNDAAGCQLALALQQGRRCECVKCSKV